MGSGADTSVSPQTDHVVIGGVGIAQGAAVRMQPGSRRADAQDLFLVGREAVVEAVLHDVDGHVHVAVLPPAIPPWPNCSAPRDGSCTSPRTS